MPTSKLKPKSLVFKRKRSFPVKMILGLVVFLIVAVGAVAGFFLSQTNQDTRQQAYEPVETCNETGGSCINGLGCPTDQTSTGGRCGNGQICCRKVTSNIACPEGSVRVSQQSNTACRCNHNGVIVGDVSAGGSCVAQVCPLNASAVQSGEYLGWCKCASDGAFVQSNGTCKPISCPTGSRRVEGQTLPCQCANTGKNIDYTGKCPDITACGMYQKKSLCNAGNANLDACLWNDQSGRCQRKPKQRCNERTTKSLCVRDLGADGVPGGVADTGGEAILCVWDEYTTTCSNANDFCAYSDESACNNKFDKTYCRWGQAPGENFSRCLSVVDDKVNISRCLDIERVDQCNSFTQANGKKCVWNLNRYPNPPCTVK